MRNSFKQEQLTPWHDSDPSTCVTVLTKPCHLNLSIQLSIPVFTSTNADTAGIVIEVSLKRSGTTVLLDNISNEPFHHSGPARRFHHRHWEANWYMFFSLVITGTLCASFNCPTACSHYEFLEGSTSEFLMNSVNFEKTKRSEKRPPWAQRMKF